MNKQRRGGSLIESTLVMMVLLTLMFSIFDSGYVLFEHHTCSTRRARRRVTAPSTPTT